MNDKLKSILNIEKGDNILCIERRKYKILVEDTNAKHFF